MTRAGLEQRVRQTLMARGAVWCSKINSGLIRTKGRAIALAPAGTPDLLALFPGGVTVWVEIKDLGDKLSDIQITSINKMVAAGHHVAIVAADPFKDKDIAALHPDVARLDEGDLLVYLGGLDV